MNNNSTPSASFPWFTALIGYSLAGVILQGSWLVGLTFFYGVTAPWTDWLFKAVAGGVAGLTTALILEQTLSFPRHALRGPLAGGWAIVWIMTHLVHFSLLGSGLSAAGITTIINLVEGLSLAALMAAIIKTQYLTFHSDSPPTGSAFWPWVIAYGAVIVFYGLFVPDFGRLTPADVPLIVFFSVAGNLLVGLLGTHLTGRALSQ
jgi:hypothetical protein